MLFNKRSNSPIANNQKRCYVCLPRPAYLTAHPVNREDLEGREIPNKNRYGKRCGSLQERQVIVAGVVVLGFLGDYGYLQLL